MVGFVDLGSGSRDNDSQKEATEMLVLKAVRLMCYVSSRLRRRSLDEFATKCNGTTGLYVDSSPRTVELCTDNEYEQVTGDLTIRHASVRDADNNRFDNGQVDNDTNKTTPTDATACAAADEHLSSSPVDVDCSAKLLEEASKYQREVNCRHKRHGQLAKEDTNDAEC